MQKDLQNVEVIVVDNGSADATASVVESYKEKIPNLISVFDNTPGLLTGRHKGIELARSEVLCFLDDDVTLNENYVAHLKEIFKDKNIHFATGPCLPNFESEPPQWLKYFWNDIHEGRYCGWLSLLDFGNRTKSISPIFVFGLNFCCRKSSVIKAGGFNPDNIPYNYQVYQGDGETGLALKAQAQNLKSVYNPGLLLYHVIPAERLSVEYFKKRAYYQGICNSYTVLREQHLQDMNIAATPKTKKEKVKASLYHLYYTIKKKIIPAKKMKLPEEIMQMKQLLNEEEKKGYLFHQSAFKNDPKVKEWVLKENYWDYKLPL